MKIAVKSRPFFIPNSGRSLLYFCDCRWGTEQHASASLESVRAILFFQNAEGFFTPTPDLSDAIYAVLSSVMPLPLPPPSAHNFVLELLGALAGLVDVSRLEGGRNVLEGVLCTLLVLALLRVTASSSEDSWRLCANRSVSNLVARIRGATKHELDTLISSVRARLITNP